MALRYLLASNCGGFYDMKDTYEREYDIMSSIYDDKMCERANESLGYGGNRFKPNDMNRVSKTVTQGAAWSLIPGGVGLAFAGINSARLRSEQKDQMLKWAITADIDSHEFEIINAINKVRDYMGIRAFNTSEVIKEPEHSTDLSILLKIPVIPVDTNVQFDNEATQYVKELSDLCKTIKFTETKKNFTTNAKAVFNANNNCIEVMVMKPRTRKS